MNHTGKPLLSRSTVYDHNTNIIYIMYIVKIKKNENPYKNNIDELYAYFSDFSTSWCYFCLLLAGYFMTFHDIIKTMFYVNELNIYTPCNTFFTIQNKTIQFINMLSFAPRSTRRRLNISSPNCYIILWQLDRMLSLWMNHTGKPLLSRSTVCIIFDFFKSFFYVLSIHDTDYMCIIIGRIFSIWTGWAYRVIGQIIYRWTLSIFLYGFSFLHNT
jgi:hypothetical protein